MSVCVCACVRVCVRACVRVPLPACPACLPACVCVDAAAGGSDDWAKAVGGIKYSYTVELRDDGYLGFQVPARDIEPSGEEMWAALVAMARAIKQREGL